MNCNGKSAPDDCQWCDMTVEQKQRQREEDFEDNVFWAASMWNVPKKSSINNNKFNKQDLY